MIKQVKSHPSVDTTEFTKQAMHSFKSSEEGVHHSDQLKTRDTFKLGVSGDMNKLASMSEEELNQLEPFFRQQVLEWKMKRKSTISK